MSRLILQKIGPTVTLDKTALGKIKANEGTDSVSITVEKTTADDLNENEKPTENDVPAGYEILPYKVEVKVGSTAITGEEAWKDGTTASQITLTIPVPVATLNASKVKVYLDSTDATSSCKVKLSEDGKNLLVTVPHLTVVNLVYPQTAEAQNATVTYTAFTDKAHPLNGYFTVSGSGIKANIENGKDYIVQLVSKTDTNNAVVTIVKSDDSGNLKFQAQKDTILSVWAIDGSLTDLSTVTTAMLQNQEVVYNYDWQAQKP